MSPSRRSTSPPAEGRRLVERARGRRAAAQPGADVPHRAGARVRRGLVHARGRGSSASASGSGSSPRARPITSRRRSGSAARIDTAGCYEPLLEPVQGRDGLYYGEYLDFAPGVARDDVASFFSRAARPASRCLSSTCSATGSAGSGRTRAASRSGRCLAGMALDGVARELDGVATRRSASSTAPSTGTSGPRRCDRSAPAPSASSAPATFCPPTFRCSTALVPRGLAREGPICARRTETWPELLRRRPGARSSPTRGRSWRRTSTSSSSSRRRRPTPSSRGWRSSTASTSSSRSPSPESRERGRSARRAWPQRETCICSRRRSSSSHPRFRALWTIVGDGALGPRPLGAGVSTATPARTGRRGTTRAGPARSPRPASTTSRA